MRVNIPAELAGKELFKYLVANKAKIIEQKKSLPIKSDPLFASPSILTKEGSEITVIKETGVSDTPDTGTLPVKVVANAAWWADSYLDVLTGTSYDNTVKAKGNSLPHLKNHFWLCDAHVGDVKDVYVAPVSLKKLGLDKPGKTPCVIWETDIQKEYDAKVYLFYKKGKINQHSIGLQYISLELAINSDDEDFEKEKKVWDKYINKIINKEKVEAAGYFWLVTEIRLLENSCVLFGANELTPTLETEKSIQLQPAVATGDEPEKKKISFGSII